MTPRTRRASAPHRPRRDAHALVLLAFALLLTPALAGCIDALDASSTDATADPADLAEPATTIVHGLDGAAAPESLDLEAANAARGALLPIGARSYEPTLAVDAEGRLFMTGAGADGRPTVYRSDDDGATWSDVGPRLPNGMRAHPFSLDPYLYLDPSTGRLFQNDLYVACSFLSWTDDAGDSWTSQPAACGVSGVKDHQSMVAAKPRLLPTAGYENVVYWCTNTGVTIECATSLNGGLTFGPAVTVFPASNRNPADFCEGIHGHPVSDAEGRVYLAHLECGVPMVGVTEDDGLTWSAFPISDQVRGDPHILMHDVNLAVDEAGNVYASWIGSDGLPYYSWSADHGRTWAKARSVSPPGVTATMLPAIDAGAEGRIVIAYVGTDIEGGYGDKPLGGSGTVGDLEKPSEPKEWESAAWHGYLTVLTDATGDAPVALTVLANDPADPLARGVCGKTRCGGMGDFIDVRIGPDGRPWAAFVDVCTDACVDDPSVLKDTPVGSVGTLATGPALRGDAPTLRALSS